MKAKRRDRNKIEENWAAWGQKAYAQIEAEGLLPLIEGDIEAYNQGLIDAHSLVRRLYHNNCLEKIQKSGINISSMATLVSALIASSVFKEGTPVDLKRASSDRGGLEDYARLMYPKVVELNVPTWVIGPPIESEPSPESPADILKIWPERESIRQLRPLEFNPIIEELATTHCR